jgi:hypothetical protein
MVFRPPRALGLAVGAAALLLAAAIAVGGLALLRALPPSPLTPVLTVVVIACVPATAWLGLRCHGLLNGRYVLTRNALSVEWGGRREVIPLGDVEEIHVAAEYPGVVNPPALRWPGCAVGRVQQPELGAMEFLATTAEKAGLVLIGYPGGWLALSPADPAAFLAAFAERRAEGAAEPVERESTQPAVSAWALWSDRPALALIALGGLGLLALQTYLVLIFPQLPPQIALRFNDQGLPIRFGPPEGVFTLVLIGAVAWGLNTVVGVILHRRAAERPAAYLLFSAAVVVQALTWVAALGLLTAGRPA